MQGNRSAVLGTRQVHVWLADLHARGGIPLYSSILLRTMLRDLPQSSFTVIVKNDPRDADSDGRHDRLTIKRLAPWPARLRTAAFAARVAYEELRSRPALVFCG
ncbi:MAG TPA: hypothetical protein VG713_05380, partial [Pirellulales bacterium]|nr:hypothetical protein [Pirellulales bacterium]